MRIAFTAKGTDWSSEIDPRFGRAEYLIVYDETEDVLHVNNNQEMKEQEHGVGPGTASKLFDMEPEVLITGNGPGGNAAAILQKAKVKIFTGAEGMSLREAYENYKNKKLNNF